MQIWDRDGDSGESAAGGRGAEAGHDALASHAHPRQQSVTVATVASSYPCGARRSPWSETGLRVPTCQRAARDHRGLVSSHRVPVTRNALATEAHCPGQPAPAVSASPAVFSSRCLVSAALSAANRYSWLRRVGRGMQHTPRGPVSTVRLKRAETSVCGTQSHRVTGHCWNVTAWNAGSGGSGR